MKRIQIIILVLVLCFACSKPENKEIEKKSTPNSAQMISGAKGPSYSISVTLGHSASECSGCVMSGGTCTHVDCQGAGSACAAKTIMQISDTEEVNLYFGTISDPNELTAEDFFLMPNRSLYIMGSNGEFINIPEQMLYRDEETGNFMIYDIFFSDFQMFENK